MTATPESVTLDFCNGSETFRVRGDISGDDSCVGLVFCLLTYDHYYPYPDNVLRSFDSLSGLKSWAERNLAKQRDDRMGEYTRASDLLNSFADGGFYTSYDNIQVVVYSVHE